MIFESLVDLPLEVGDTMLCVGLMASEYGGRIMWKSYANTCMTLSRRGFGVIAASFFTLKCAENVHIDVKFQRMVHFEYDGFSHVMNTYLVLSFALF